MQKRTINTTLKTRSYDNEEELYIEGYFSVFNQETELFKGAYEEIAPTAFNNSLKNNDIRCLINHDTSLILGRTGNKTLELRADNYGLYGKVKINRDDIEAMNLYARVKRGDVNACSFGFSPVEEETQNRDDGGVKWLIREANTFEVSVVSFPAYEGTEITVRKKQFENISKRELELKKQKWKERVKNGTSTTKN